LSRINLARGYFLREFRDYVLHRLNRSDILNAVQENIILVGVRGPGHSSIKSNIDICYAVKSIMKRDDFVLFGYSTRFQVICIEPHLISFEEEILMARRSKLVISEHGTVSYLVLFAQDHTQQIVLGAFKKY
jgi:hypothetical protein